MTHLKTLKLLNFAIGAYTMIFGLFGLLWIFIGLWQWDQDGAWLAILFGLIMFLLLGGIAATHIVVGYLVGSGRGRVVQTMLASTQLMSFPVGTAYALYALWVCWVNDESVKKFESSIKPGVS